MVMIVATPRLGRREGALAEPTVVNCYALFDKFFPTCGLLDYTEGIYHGDATTPLEAAQLEEIRYVLDQVHCQRGRRILDIGCGNGTLLDERVAAAPSASESPSRPNRQSCANVAALTCTVSTITTSATGGPADLTPSWPTGQSSISCSPAPRHAEQRMRSIVGCSRSSIARSTLIRRCGG